MVPVETERLPGLDIVRDNATTLNNILAAIARTPTGSGILYFPPGRYYLGRRPDPLPPPTEITPISGVRRDFVIPETVTLRFAPGATLVPVNFEALGMTDRRLVSVSTQRGRVSLREEESERVRVEIRGHLEAGLYNIFDAVMEDLAFPDNQDLDADSLHEAGVIVLAGNAIREVYPEWWGAAVPKNLATTPDDGLPEAVVRRTTLALQEAFHAAHTRRGPLWYITSWGVPTLNLTPTPEYMPPPIDSLPSVRRPYTPPIPIVLTGEYVIDAELQLGEGWRDAERVTGPRELWGTADGAHPTNVEGFVLRGARAPSPSGAGGATIRAHRSWREERDLASGHYQARPDPAGITTPRVPAQSGSLLAVRNVDGYAIENVTFDAAYRAPRCFTTEVPARENLQMAGLRGCAFRGALRELVHLGGEIPFGILFDRRRNPDTGNKTFRLPSNHWTGDQDLLGFRLERCTFDTGDLARRDAGLREWQARSPESLGLTTFFRRRPLCGLVIRAAQALFIELFNCSFVGPAAPMVFCSAGGPSFHRCFFHTAHMPVEADSRGRPNPAPEHTLEGLDVFLDFAISDPDPAVPSITAMPACRMKNVVSRSPRLIATFLRVPGNAGTSAAVQLIAVEHLPTVASGEALLPAILWAGGAHSFSRLVLMGCRFVRPHFIGAGVGSPLSARFPEPVLVDLWPWIDPAADAALPELTLATTAWEGGIRGRYESFGRFEAISSRGHVVDLGTKVEGGSGRLVAMSAGAYDRLDLLRRSSRNVVNNFQLVQRYTPLDRR